MSAANRSGCPLNLAVEIVGDRWTLVVLRDIIVADRRHFRELLQHSAEGITSTVLAARLRTLIEHGLLRATEDPGHKQKIVYSLTESGVELLPVLILLGAWGAANTQSDPKASMWFRILGRQSPEVWDQLKAELLARHLAAPGSARKPEPTFERLTAESRRQLTEIASIHA